MQKRKIYIDTEREFSDAGNPIFIMRNRDTDGDGIKDYIDNNYSKPSDNYLYRVISQEDYFRLHSIGFDTEQHCCKSPDQPNAFILQYKKNQTEEIETVLNPILHRAVVK